MNRVFAKALTHLQAASFIPPESVRESVNGIFRETLQKKGYPSAFEHVKVGRNSYSFRFKPLDKLHPDVTELTDAKPLFSDLHKSYGLSLYAHGTQLFDDVYELRKGFDDIMTLTRISDISLSSHQFEVNFRQGDIIFRLDRDIDDGEVMRAGFAFNDVFSQPVKGQDIKSLEALLRKS